MAFASFRSRTAIADLGVVVHFANDLGGRLYLPNERDTLARP
jgi:hypothetical protein